MSYGYSYKDYNKDVMSRAVLLSSDVSTKHCIEICSRIRGKKPGQARRILQDAIAMKVAIPFTKFNHNVGHRRGIGSGRYPVKACKEVLRLLEVCEANAQFKGIGTDLRIVHCSANLASRPWHYGRARRRKMKRTHIEMVLEEFTKKEPGKGSKEKPAAKAEVREQEPSKSDKAESVKDIKKADEAKPLKADNEQPKSKAKGSAPAKKPQKAPAKASSAAEPKPAVIKEKAKVNDSEGSTAKPSAQAKQ